MFLDELIYLTKSETVRTLSGKPKKLYKYAIVATFFNVVNGKQLQAGQLGNVEIAKEILKNPKECYKKYNLEAFKNEVEKCLSQVYFHNTRLDTTIDKLFEFFREKLVALQNNKRFWQASEFEKIIDLEKFYKDKSGTIKKHHWIDFNIEQGLIPTIPDFITYGDFINSWNILLQKWNEYNIYSEAFSEDIFGYMELRKSEESRKIEYEIFTLQRICYTSCVTFVEAYLFYLFYNFKMDNILGENEAIRKLYDLNISKVNDTHIIEKIIIPHFIKEEVQENINKLYAKYKEINKVRNAVIHTTAFENRSIQKSTMESFFEIDLKSVEQAMTNSLDLILLIDRNLPEEFKLLYWWDLFESPDLSKWEQISIVNKNSNISNLSTF